MWGVWRKTRNGGMAASLIAGSQLSIAGRRSDLDISAQNGHSSLCPIPATRGRGIPDLMWHVLTDGQVIILLWAGPPKGSAANLIRTLVDAAFQSEDNMRSLGGSVI